MVPSGNLHGCIRDGETIHQSRRIRSLVCGIVGLGIGLGQGLSREASAMILLIIVFVLLLVVGARLLRGFLYGGMGGWGGWGRPFWVGWFGGWGRDRGPGC